MRSLGTHKALYFLALCTIGSSCAIAADNASRKLDGKAVLEKHCARCHSLEKTGVSPLKQAPPLREIYRSYPIARLEFELSEGIGSRHRDMPQIQFSTEEITGILKYLGSLMDPE
jgi:mono/diheme cytochrome c family protein